MIAHIPTKEDSVCQIIRIVDGDTVEMQCKRKPAQSVRLVGFDTPETHRPGCAAERALGEKATARLTQELSRAKVVLPDVQGKDKYQRPLVRLSLDGRDLADIMVTAGLAVRYDGGKRIDWCARLS